MQLTPSQEPKISNLLTFENQKMNRISIEMPIELMSQIELMSMLVMSLHEVLDNKSARSAC